MVFTYSVVNCLSGLRMFSITSSDISSAYLATILGLPPRPAQLHSCTRVPIVKTVGQYVYNTASRASSIHRLFR